MGVLATVALQRVVELLVSRRNEQALLRRGAVRARPDAFGLFVVVHALAYVSCAAEWLWAPWSHVGPHTAAFLGLGLAAAALRYWAAWSLGPHYTVRVLKLARAPLVTAGPYRWMRHPIYWAVLVEIPAVPLAFGAWGTALAFGALNAVAVLRRKRLEERFLGLA